MGVPQETVKAPGEPKSREDEQAALTIAQDVWGQGHLSPLEEVFESQALVALIPTKASKFAVIAPHVGARLQRYSKETGLWIDAFESEPTLARALRDKGIKATFKPWDASPKLLGTAKFTEVFAFQIAQLSHDLPKFYGQLAKSLRPGGNIFVGDLAPVAGRGGLGPTMRPLAEHCTAIKGAGLEIAKEFDLSREITLKIRRGFLKGAESLASIRKLEEPEKERMTAAFLAQVERWAVLAMLLEAERVTAFGLLAGLPAT